MRVLAAFLPASIITVALFCLMQYLVSSGHRPPARVDYRGFVDLIHLQADNEDRATPREKHSYHRQQAVVEDTPPAPRAQSKDVKPPELSPLSIATPPPLPLQVATAPYLGTFQHSMDSAKLPTQTDVDSLPRQKATVNPEPGLSPVSPAADLPLGPGGHGEQGEAFALLRIEPVYPRKAAKNEQEGWVKVEFTITERGTVIDPVVVDSHPRRVFNRSALAAIRKWRFQPRMVAGKPVASRAIQIIEFSLAGR